MLSRQMPVVRVMGGPLTAADIDYVGPDNFHVGYVACEYLLNQGLTELAFLTNCIGWDFIEQRAMGFMSCATSARIRPTMYLEGGDTPRHMLYGHDPVIESSCSRLIARLAETRRGPVGLFVPRDSETTEVYAVLREHRLEPGRDVIVVSCDNEQMRIATLSPRPMSIDLQPADIARRSVRRLLQRIKNPTESTVRMLVLPKLPISSN